MIIAEPSENYCTGYIKLFRSLENKSWYNKSAYVHLWLHILIKAGYKEREFWFNGKPIILKKGQFITGRESLAKETGLHSSSVERILTYFEKIEHQIEQQKSNKNRIITVLNWDSYQISEQQIEQPLNNQRTTNEQPLNTNNNSNNINKENKVKDKKMTESHFEKFWDIYPSKVNKKKAKEKFMKLDTELFETIMYALEWQTQSISWKNGYIPNPETYINNEKWNDKPKPIVNNNWNDKVISVDEEVALMNSAI